MPSQGGGSRPLLGGAFLVLGAGTLTLAFGLTALSGVPRGLPAVAGVPGEVLVLGLLGLVLLVVGVYMLQGARHAKAPSTTTVVEETEPEPQKRSRPPSSPTGTYVDRSGDRDEGPPSPEEQRMDDLESQIKAIDRRMSQAKVKLGTGELSPEGYQKVMEELEEKRAQLEKKRVDLELDQSEL